MANEVKIKVTAEDNASKSLEKITKTFDGFGSAILGTNINLTELLDPMKLATKAVEVISQQFKEGIAFNIDYAKQVEDTSRKLGITAEEASKLIQVTDDLRIDYSALEMAMRTALDKGIAPSIENLAKMGEEYKALKTPIEKAQYAIDKFGSRAGLEMQKVLELSTKDLLAMGDAVEVSGLLMSQDGVDAAKEYALAVDGLEDSWNGLRNRLVKDAIPAITDATNALSGYIQFEDLKNEAIKRGIELDYRRAGSGLQVADTVETLTAKIVAYDKALVDSQRANEEFRLSEKAVELGVIDTEEAQLRLAETMDRRTSITQELATADELAAARTEALYAVTVTASEAMKTYSAELLYNKIAANLDAESALSLATQMGLVDERTRFAITEVQNITKAFDANGDGIISADEDLKGYIATIAGLNNALANLPSDKFINVNVKVTGDPLPQFTNNAGVTIEARAGGGPMYQGQRYIVGEGGYPETVIQGANGGYVYPTTNNYNLTINSQARSEQVQASFALMQALAR